MLAQPRLDSSRGPESRHHTPDIDRCPAVHRRGSRKRRTSPRSLRARLQRGSSKAPDVGCTLLRTNAFASVAPPSRRTDGTGPITFRSGRSSLHRSRRKRSGFWHLADCHVPPPSYCPATHVDGVRGPIVSCLAHRLLIMAHRLFDLSGKHGEPVALWRSGGWLHRNMWIWAVVCGVLVVSGWIAGTESNPEPIRTLFDWIERATRYATAIGLPVSLISAYRMRCAFEQTVRDHDGLVCGDCGHPFGLRGASVVCPECGTRQNTEEVREAWRRCIGGFGWKPTELSPPSTESTLPSRGEAGS